MEKKLLERFKKKQINSNSTNQTKFRNEKLIKQKGNKFYIKWKGYDNLFNSWIGKKDINEAIFS